MKKSVVAVVLFLLAGASAMADDPAVYQKKEPKVWMCKGGFGELGARPQDWVFVQSQCMDYIDLYRSTGSLPDYYVIQSWYNYPGEYVPEDQPFTMTNLVKKVILKLRPYLQTR